MTWLVLVRQTHLERPLLIQGSEVFLDDRRVVILRNTLENGEVRSDVFPVSAGSVLSVTHVDLGDEREDTELLAGLLRVSNTLQAPLMSRTPEFWRPSPR
jgi:hypothetical protein